jgi:hypothetical protein
MYYVGSGRRCQRGDFSHCIAGGESQSIFSHHVLYEVQLESLRVWTLKAHSDANCLVSCNHGLQKEIQGSAAAAVVNFRIVVASDDLELFFLDKDVCDHIPVRTIIKDILDDPLCER